jgi:hypothetical protein
MDNFQPQSGDLHVAAGHEGGDFSIRGIILFIAILVVSAVLTFIAAGGLLRLFEWYERTHLDQPGSAVQQQLSEQRGEMAPKEGVRPQPDWYNREIDEKVLQKTFAAPRLQYDDATDMTLFLNSESQLLNGTGKYADGSVHIPIDQAIDLVAKQGLPPVNGTFTAQPPLGGLMAVSEAAQNRVKAAGEQVQPPVPQSNKKK